MIAAPAPSAMGRRIVVVSAIAMLIAMLALRYLGPSDLYDQTQPKTISYTTDIIVHGGSHWILPIERGELPATKPPLYNWLAVPAVKWLGFNSEIAHKLPSIAAMLACWLIIVRTGRALRARPPTAGSLGDPGASSANTDDSLGWLAGLLFVSTYAVFKLGYLARPDMLLTLWLLIAWVCATRVFVELRRGATASDQRESAVTAADGVQHARPNRWRSLAVAPVIGFWLAIALAGLTKGPAVLVMMLYIVIAARVIGGRWGAIRALYPIVGGLFALLVCGAWVFAVWKINPDHLKQELWFNEIYGRLTGSGAEGTQGRQPWFRELHYQVFYYFTRFVPWSFVALGGAGALWWRSRADRVGATASERPPMRVGRAQEGAGNEGTADSRWSLAVAPVWRHTQLERWMHASLLFVVIVVGLFSLSVGKRADYVAVAYPQTALLAAWWLLHGWPHIAVRWPWLTPLAAAVNLASISIYDHRQIWAPVPGFGDGIKRFVDEATLALAAEPRVVMNCSAGQTHLQAVLGIAQDDQRRQIPDAIARGEEFWVLAGRTQNPPHEFDLWLRQRRLSATAEAVMRSAELPRADGWPGQVTLWRVTPSKQGPG